MQGEAEYICFSLYFYAVWWYSINGIPITHLIYNSKIQFWQTTNLQYYIMIFQIPSTIICWFLRWAQKGLSPLASFRGYPCPPAGAFGIETFTAKSIQWIHPYLTMLHRFDEFRQIPTKTSRKERIISGSWCFYNPTVSLS